MKILLLSPFYTSPFKYSESFPPTGLAYLAAYVRSKGLGSPRIYDLSVRGKSRQGKFWRHGLEDGEIAGLIRNEDPDVVGVSCQFSCRYTNSLSILDIAKRAKPGVITCIGGPHSTLFPGKAVENAAVDFCVTGEGELTFAKMLESLQATASLKAAKEKLVNEEGLAFMMDDGLVFNKRKTYIQDLDMLPFPAWDLADVEKYFELNIPYWSLRGRMMPLLTSRSCPNRCTFCSMYRTHGPKWRGRSAENVVDEIEQLRDRYSITSFNVTDDNFTYDPDRVIKICTLICERKLDKLSWNTPNGISIKTLNRDVVRAMKAAGCTEVNLAIESGDETMRNQVIRKNLATEKILEAVSFVRDAGMRLNVYIVVGMPGETKETIASTISLLGKFKAYGLGIYYATPYPGAVLWDVCSLKGYLPPDYEQNISREDHLVHSQPVIRTESFNEAQIRKWRTKIARFFIIHNLLEIMRWEIRKPFLLNIPYLYKRVRILFS